MEIKFTNNKLNMTSRIGLISLLCILLKPVMAVVGIPELGSLDHTSSGYYNCFVSYAGDTCCHALTTCQNNCYNNAAQCKYMYRSTTNGYCGYYT